MSMAKLIFNKLKLSLVMRFCDGKEHEEDASRRSSILIVESPQESRSPGPSDYFSVLRRIVANLPGELGGFGSIPCAQRSLYTGILAGGVVSAASLIVTGIE